MARLPKEDLERLYTLYGYAVHRRCMQILRDRAEADDAVQEVFLRVYKYGDTRKGDSPLGWLYKISDRHCFDVVAKRKRRASEGRTEPPFRVEAGVESSPDKMRLVAQVLGACPPRVQEVAVLYYVDEMTQEEVAGASGYSRKT